MSILRIVFSKKIIKDRQSRDFFEKNKSSNIVKFKNFLFKNNIYYPNNGIIFISASHSKSEISYAANVIIEGLRKFFNENNWDYNSKERSKRIKNKMYKKIFHYFN